MSPLRLNGSTSGYSQIDPPAVANDQIFTLPGTGGTLDRLNRVGNILQVVQSTYTTNTSITSTSFTDTGLSATITPSSTTSKILVCANFNALVSHTANTANAAIQLLRGSTVIYSLLNGANNNGFLSINAGVGASSALYILSTASLKYLDSPATTSAVTYKTQGRVSVAGPTISFQPGSDTAIMILMEVAA